MVVTKKDTTSKRHSPLKATSGHVVSPVIKLTAWQKRRTLMALPFKKIQRRVRELLARRPHRSFRRTWRRDYVRSLKLPGYWAFTVYVGKIIWQQRKLFSLLIIAYGLLTVTLVGITSQDIYSQLDETLRATGGELFTGNWGEVGKAGLLLVSGLTGTMTETLTPAQQIYGILLILLTWLTTVWLLRAIMAGRKPKLRDGLYNAGAPILPTFLVSLLLTVQLLPAAVAMIGFSAASASGLLDTGIEAMLFWTCAALLGALSLYWITSTVIALVVVTLPGMYPMRAIKTAGDLVIGRRVRILLRMSWLLLMLAIVWLVIMIPIILFDAWLKRALPAIEWLPIVPIALLVMSTLTVIWSASYVYILYRKVVDDDAAPA